jgi:putative membrane protein
MIKSVIQAFLVNLASLWVADYFLTGFDIRSELKVYAIAAVVLILVNFIVRPILNIISFPINLVTLGLFSWLLNIALIYIVVLLVDGIRLAEGILQLDRLGIIALTLPNIDLTRFFTLVVATFIIGFVNWLLRKLVF